jgi:DHA3 family macrolide efflux protein-like MFS transporter
MKVNFKLFLFGQFFSGLTSMIVQYALIWYLTKEYESAAILSISTILGILPMVILGMFSGGIIDRFNRKSILMLSDIFVAFFALMLFISGIFQKDLPLALVFLALFVRSSGQAFQKPTIQAMIPTLVAESDLTRANGQVSATEAINVVLAPIISATLFTFFDIHQLMLFDILGAIIGCSILLKITIPKLTTAPLEKSTPFQDVRFGFKAVWRITAVRNLTMLVLFFNLMVMPCASFFPLMTTQYFHGTIGQVGLVETCFGVGMVLGSVLIGSGGGFKDRIKMMACTFLMLGVLFFPIAFLPRVFLGFVAFIGLSISAAIGFPVVNASLMSLLQQTYPPETLGRIMAILMSLSQLAVPLGLLVSTPIAENIGVNMTFITASFACLICGLACFWNKTIRQYDKKLNEEKS